MQEPRSFRPKLLRWYDLHRRDLPWRRTKDPYHIWVSEVMLQQTQVSTVIPYWHKFLERFPSIEALAKAELPDVLAHWRGLGYYSRARNLHRAAQELFSRGRNRLPCTAAELLELPGLGRYTAGAVASIAFGEQAPVVDGNVARVLCRLFAVEGAVGEPSRERRLWELAAQLVLGPRPGDFNQALMELGATVCKPESPDCPTCPLRRDCAAFKNDLVTRLPRPKVRAPRKRLRLAAAFWRQKGKVLLARRQERGLFAGLWELPTQTVSERSNQIQWQSALQGVLGEEVEIGPLLGRVQRTLTHRELEILLLPAKGGSAPRRLPGYAELTWATPAQADALGMSTAMQKALEVAMASSQACRSQ